MSREPTWLTLLIAAVSAGLPHLAAEATTLAVEDGMVDAAVCVLGGGMLIGAVGGSVLGGIPVGLLVIALHARHRRARSTKRNSYSEYEY